MATDTAKNGPGAIELERTHTDTETGLGQKVYDGDEALKVLHTHFEPYTEAEEKGVLRKIDLRMCLLMLVINGVQFVDKNVRLELSLLKSSTDH